MFLQSSRRYDRLGKIKKFNKLNILKENKWHCQKDVNQSQNLSKDQPKVDISSQDETEKSSDNKNLSSSEFIIKVIIKIMKAINLFSLM